MTLVDVTRPAVLAAIGEFDRLGRDAFLKAAGFGHARTYYVVVDDHLYDSKAIAGYAHGVATGVFLQAADFTGGEQSVAARLRALGFDVRNLGNPDWTRDEVILTCELVADNGWRGLGEYNPQVKELSQLLQTPAIFPLDQRGPTFRNNAGVARKTADIATRHPSYTGAPTKGGKVDREVLADFLANPEEMRIRAAAIRAALSADDAEPLSASDLDLEDVAADEGGVLLRQHLRRERDPRLKERKIATTRNRGQAISCEVCGFDFEQVYGDRGRDYIECHHRTPLHITGKTKTKLDDLALICSNCHRMIHRTKVWLLPEQLRDIVRTRRTV